MTIHDKSKRKSDKVPLSFHLKPKMAPIGTLFTHPAQAQGKIVYISFCKLQMMSDFIPLLCYG